VVFLELHPCCHMAGFQPLTAGGFTARHFFGKNGFGGVVSQHRAPRPGECRTSQMLVPPPRGLGANGACSINMSLLRSFGLAVME
jgi:hypothetical protein